MFLSKATDRTLENITFTLYICKTINDMIIITTTTIIIIITIILLIIIKKNSFIKFDKPFSGSLPPHAPGSK